MLVLKLDVPFQRFKGRRLETRRGPFKNSCAIVFSPEQDLSYSSRPLYCGLTETWGG